MSLAIALILACIIIAVAVGYGAYCIARVSTPLLELPGRPGTRASLDSHVLPIEVSVALEKAQHALVEFGPWTHTQVEGVIERLAIIIGARCVGAAHRDARGVVWLYVDRRLTTLARELAHACELELEGAMDGLQRTWESRGLFKAMQAYALTLGVRSESGEHPCAWR
jgi:hypothetical protein